MWAREIRRDIAGALSYAANKELLGEDESKRALRLLEILLRDPDPTEETEARDAENGYDPGMLALNSVRGEATTAAIELLLESRRTDRSTLADATAAMLRHTLASDQSRSVRAAIGIRLPWVLANDEAHLAEWIDLTFGDAVPRTARTAAWDAYLLYSRFFSSEAAKLAHQYDLAVTRLEPQPEDETGRRLQTDEHLGIHVAAAHLLDLDVEQRGNWLTEFYRRAAAWARARVTRWIAEQAAAADATPQVRARARDFLRQRNEPTDAEADAEELKAVSWIAPATDDLDEILEILLAALEKTARATEIESGAVAFAARMSTTRPRRIKPPRTPEARGPLADPAAGGGRASDSHRAWRASDSCRCTRGHQTTPKRELYTHLESTPDRAVRAVRGQVPGRGVTGRRPHVGSVSSQ